MKKSTDNTIANLTSLLANKKVTVNNIKFTGTGAIARFAISKGMNDIVKMRSNLTTLTPENLAAALAAPSPKQARIARQAEAKKKAAQRKKERAAAKRAREAAKRTNARAKKAAQKNKKSVVKVARTPRTNNTVGKTQVTLTKSPARKPARRMARTVAPMM